MNRAAWNAQRRRIRDSYPNRAERGLPPHPDGSGLAPCNRCPGTGMIEQPHWCPELAESQHCVLCDGTGMMADGYRDPLLRLRYARQSHVRRAQPATYHYLRQLCAVPAWQLRLIEAAVGCDLATRQAVDAWRQVRP